MKSLVYTSTAILVLLLSSCYIGNGQFGIRGEGPIVERKVDLDPVKGISLPGSAKIFLTYGTKQEIRISGQENIIDNLKLDVQGGIWHLGNKQSVRESEPLKIYITLETLKLIRISGSGSVECENHFPGQNNLDLEISGSGKIHTDIEASDIMARISGSGDLVLRGSAKNLDFRITGSGSINAFDLPARRADARISGSGSIELTVEDRLDARISGSGNVYYKGNPRIDTSVSGSGRVKSR